MNAREISKSNELGILRARGIRVPHVRNVPCLDIICVKMRITYASGGLDF
jgi:hypothetical protein